MYDTDQEQIEAMKSWWEKNGNWVIAGVLIFIASYSGFLWYQNNSQQQSIAASMTYDRLLLNLTSADADEGERQALSGMLKSDYADMGYGVMAALIEAKVAVDAGDLDSALAELNWAESNADDSLMPVILYRKAMVQYGLDQLEAALATLDSIDGTGHTVLSSELKGDIYLEQGNLEQARAAYQAAIDASEDESINNPYLQIKLNDIAANE